MPSINTAYNLGMDALKSMFALLFDPNFKFFKDQGLTQDQLSFRVPTFTVPADGMSTYEINHLAHKFTRPGGKIEQTKELTIELRIDQNYKVYQAFKNWKDAVLNTETGVIGDITLGLTTGLQVFPVKSDGSVIAGVNKFQFNEVFCKQVGELAFDSSSADAMTCQMTLVFLTMSTNIAQGDEYSYTPEAVN